MFANANSAMNGFEHPVNVLQLKKHLPTSSIFCLKENCCGSSSSVCAVISRTLHRFLKSSGSWIQWDSASKDCGIGDVCDFNI